MILDAIGSLFRNQSIENPATPIGWGMFSESGVESSAGVMVSRMNALGFHPYYRGMDLVSSYVGKLPLHIERVGEGVREKATDHPNYNHLLWRPSPEMSALQWKKSMEFLRMDEGNGYTFLRRRGDGTIIEFVLLNAAETWPVRANGRLYYLTKSASGQDQLLLREDVIHIRNLCGSELRGYGLRHLGRNSIGAGIATIEYRARFFRNGAAPLVVIEVPGDLPPERKKALADGWNQIHAGVSHAHKTGVLTNGAKANILSANAQQNQLTEQEKFSIIEVSNLIGIPPHKLGDGSRTAYNSLEQENQSFLDDSLDWRLVDWEQELWDKVLTEQQKRDRSYEICFDREQLIRADLAAMGTFLSQAVGGPVLTVDEGREKLRMNKRPGLEGDVLYGPGGAGVPGQAGADGGGTGDAAPVLRDQMETYGIGVRAGSITPQTDDEEYFRSAAGLPPISDDATRAWQQDRGVRRPVTLAAVADTRTSSGAPPAPQQGGSDGEPADPGTAPPTNHIRDSHRALLARSCQKMAERIAGNSKRRAKDPKGFMEWLDEISDHSRAVMVEEFKAPLAACHAVLGIEQNADELAERLITAASEQLLEVSGAATADGLEGAVNEWSKRFAGAAVNELVDEVFVASAAREAA